MDCLLCKQPMIVLELDEVEVDYCISCKGIWLDAGELELLLEDSTKKNDFLSSFEKDKTTKEKSRKCPICKKRMENVRYGNETTVLIDRCKKNHGLWFDEGELEEVIHMGSLNKNNRVIMLLKDIFGNK